MTMDSNEETGAKLPVTKAKLEILKALYAHNSVIFVGETACGKTTQIPQYIFEAGFSKNKCIGITQPRRVAAITIAKRVSQEMRTELGGKVGYSVRFENVTSSATRIKYLTDGMLLRESLGDKYLSEYRVIILDEAHERTLCNDILCGIVKLAQKVREQQKMVQLKIVVMSATLDHRRLSEYFDAPVFFISGREYSIKILNSLKSQEDYVFAALVTVFQIHQNEDNGDILVFCTGQEEIDSMVTETRKTALNLPAGYGQLIPCALYAALPTDQQTAVLKPLSQGCRKVIFATNIAETSITIPGIKYVVDTGMVKVRSYNSQCGFDVLSIQRISKAQADQRAGRAGREFDGMCYRLYTTDEYKAFKEQSIPEILRCCLSSAVLQMIAVEIQNIYNFDFIDKPSEENIAASIKQLKLLDAVIENGSLLQLTEIGKKMVNFPLDPVYSKMIITSQTYRCTDEILTIISLLSVESIFYSPLTQREKLAEARKKFESSDGDHIMLLNVYKSFKNAKGSPDWCRENFINIRNIRHALNIRKQLNLICAKGGIKPCSAGEDTLRIRKCLASGLFMNAVLFHKNKAFRVIASNQKVKMHPSSCLFHSTPSCCIYTELVQTSKLLMRNVTSINEDALMEVAPSYFEDKQIAKFLLSYT